MFQQGTCVRVRAIRAMMPPARMCVTGSASSCFAVGATFYFLDGNGLCDGSELWCGQCCGQGVEHGDLHESDDGMHGDNDGVTHECLCDTDWGIGLWRCCADLQSEWHGQCLCCQCHRL